MAIAATRTRMTVVLALWACGCAAGDRELEPDELDARDLLGLAPAVAAGWDADARAAARARLMDAWAESWNEDGGAIIDGAGWPDPATAGEDAVAGLGAVDRRRADAGQTPVIAGAGVVAGRRLRMRIASPIDLGLDDAVASDAQASAVIEPVGWRPDEAALMSRGVAWAIDLAAAAGHPPGAPLRLHAVRQVPFGAVYLDQVGVLVNPVLLASIEPSRSSAIAGAAAVVRERESGSTIDRGRDFRRSTGGNPYSFYGSAAECAAAERLRCEACLPSSTCERTSRDAADGNAECETLAGGNGIGYHLYCVNLSLAIATVAECVGDEGPGCPQDNGASNQLVRLEANRAFLDDAACGGALDRCLASIYGESGDDFPPPPPDAGPGPDGGEPPPPPPPRDTEITCGEADCDFSPQCDSSCSGSCDEVFSCNADCNGGDDGCNDGCDGDGGGDGSGGDGGGCDSGGDGGGGGNGSGGGCGGDSDCGGDCSNGDCGGDCSNGDCGGDCNSNDCGDCNSSGGSNCSVARQARRGGVCRRAGNRDALLALAWALAPIPDLERRRRRARRLARGEEAPR